MTSGILNMLFQYQDFYCSGIDSLSTSDSFYNVFFLLLETVFVSHEKAEQKYSLAQHLTLIWINHDFWEE